MPFARLLVPELNPHTVVDLGMEDGIAFSAFCSAVKLNGLASRCYAVDPWSGEPPFGHDGGYASGIAALVREHYASFAVSLTGVPGLLADLFAPATVDLLHLGGKHTYASAKALFQAWLPKLSDRGVVLVHHTLDHEGDGGVLRFWEEVCQHHPSFEFHHNGGLGVVAPGSTAPACVSALAGLTTADGASLRQQLAALAEQWFSNAGMAHATARRTDDQQGDDSLASQLALLRQQLASSSQETDLLRLQLERVRTSVSWRVMGPYRVVGRMMKRRVVTPLKAPRPERQQLRDFRRISRSGAFDASYFLGRESPPEQRDDVSREYLAASRSGIPRGRQNPGAPQRRPMPGFHPLAYAAQCQSYDETRDEDPLAHYLRSGMPQGPWKHPVIRAHRPRSPGNSGLRILIHAHFHYPDLLAAFLQRLRCNASMADLVITTTSTDKAAVIEDVLAAENARATTLVVPNRGRDIGPLLMHFDKIEGYDVVGHVHGKRSPQQSGGLGDNWRTFLWDHLVGGGSPMVDVIADAFAGDERLGLVLAEDPYLNHWDMNQSIAESLASRLGLREKLPPHFEFPKGTMFYARPAALRPLVDLGWNCGALPAEPVEPDGTILHALERMFAFSAAHAGFYFKAVHVPHSWRLPGA